MKYAFSFIFLVVCVSCATTNYLTIDVKSPAAVTFPQEVKNILIVNNSSSDTKKNKEDASSFGIISNDSAKAIMLNSLKKFMNEEKFFSKVDLYPKGTSNSDSLQEMKPLQRSQIRSLIRGAKADALISLDLYIISAGVESSSVYYFNDYSFLSSHVGAILRTYDADGNMLTRPVMCLDSLFLETSQDRGSRRSKIAEINGLVSELSVKAADHLTSAFIPSWKTQNRWFFSDNSSDMKRAAQMVKEEKWEEAADIWSLLYDKEKNTNKKIKLASNLALANECLDDIDNALAWITIAYNLIPHQSKSELSVLTAMYQRNLEERKASKPRLYQQLGLELEDNSTDELPIEE